MPTVLPGGTISINHDLAAKEAAKLQDLAENLQLTNNAVQSALNNVGAFWEGQAASAFVNASEQWRRELRSLGEEARAIAQLILQVSGEMQEAERRTLAAIAAGVASGAGSLTPPRPSPPRVPTSAPAPQNSSPRPGDLLQQVKSKLRR